MTEVVERQRFVPIVNELNCFIKLVVSNNGQDRPKYFLFHQWAIQCRVKNDSREQLLVLMGIGITYQNSALVVFQKVAQSVFVEFVNDGSNV